MANEEHLRSDEDIEAILRIAVRGADTSGEMLRERLTKSAAELGISEAQLAEAEERYRKEMTVEREKKAEEELERKEWEAFRQEQLHGLYSHLGVYLVVNLFLVGMNFFMSGSLSWAVWSLLGWGIGVGCHAVATMAARSEDNMAEFAKWQRKKRKREKRLRESEK